MIYRVRLTPLAEGHYRRLRANNDFCVRFGITSADDIKRFRLVQYALDHILVVDPHRGLKLPSVVCYVHLFVAGDRFIHYKIDEEDPTVWVTSINEDCPELNTALAQGKFTRIWELLGVKPGSQGAEFSQALGELDTAKVRQIFKVLELPPECPDVDLKEVVM